MSKSTDISYRPDCGSSDFIHRGDGYYIPKNPDPWVVAPRYDDQATISELLEDDKMSLPALFIYGIMRNKSMKQKMNTKVDFYRHPKAGSRTMPADIVWEGKIYRGMYGYVSVKAIEE